MTTFDHGYALLIGVGTHTEPLLSLPPTVNDVLALEQLLRDPERCAYPSDHIHTLANADATVDQITRELRWLQTCAQQDPNATVLVYFSGHGGRSETGDTYALITHEALTPETGFTADAFTAQLDAIRAQRLLVILDCCHAEGMAVVKNANRATPLPWVKSAPTEAELQVLAQGQGRVVLSSSRGMQQSYILNKSQLSVFTKHLLEALQGAGNRAFTKEVRVGNLISYLSDKVPYTTRTLYRHEQEPWYQGSFESFPVALIRGGQGLGKGGWDAAAESEAEAVTSAVAAQVQRLIIQQSGGVFMPGATFGDNATITGGNSYGGDHVQGNKHVGHVHVDGGTIYGPVTGLNTGTANAPQPTSAHRPYEIICTPAGPWRVGVEEALDMVVRGMHPNTTYTITVRGAGIDTVTERFSRPEVTVYVTPLKTGDLPIRILLHDADNTQVATIKTMLVVR